MNVDFLARCEQLMASVAVDAVAIVPSANMVYFTGLHFHLSERPTMAFITREGIAFIIPQLELTKLDHRADLKPRTFAWSDANGYQQAFQDALSALRLTGDKTLGVDGMTMRVFEWLALGQAGLKLDQTQDVGQQLLLQRAIKTPYELNALKHAILIAEEALAKTLERVHVGMTEVQIVSVLSEELQTGGSEGHSFEPIVLIGEKSALPHGNPSDRVLAQNEVLLIDFGCRKDGYPSDITRTFVMGTPSNDFRRIYEAVKEANAAARAFAKPGVTCEAVDSVARAVIEKAGFGQYFTHRTGHGLGLEVHELPNISPNNDMVLQVGMVFTIEPGIYIPNVGGVRIEDNVVITETGSESLTTFPRDLQTL